MEDGAPAPGAALRQGWLDKLPAKRTTLFEKKAWKRRWITLFPDRICWSDDPSGDPKGQLPLAGCEAKLQGPKKEGDEHRLVIGSLDNKIQLTLRGDESDLAEWLREVESRSLQQLAQGASLGSANNWSPEAGKSLSAPRQTDAWKNYLQEPCLLCALSFDIAAAVSDFPPRFTCSNKELLHQACVERVRRPAPEDKMNFYRFGAGLLPSQVNATPKNWCIVKEGVFEYPPSDDAVSEWHVNFADKKLFGFYHNDLFAQDEVQTMEHPALVSIKLCLDSTLKGTSSSEINFSTEMRIANLAMVHATPLNTNLSGPAEGASSTEHAKAFTSEDAGATPCLITNVPRVCSLNLEPADGGPPLYGNNFKSAHFERVLAATNFHLVPSPSNIVAMEAPKTASGDYTLDQVTQILSTAFTAFASCRLVDVTERAAAAAAAVDLVDPDFEVPAWVESLSGEDPKTHSEKVKEEGAKTGEKVITRVHTGHWGCGAYGGNRSLMAILQALAARAAQVELVYHAFDEKGVTDVAEGLNELDRICQRLIARKFADASLDTTSMYGTPNQVKMNDIIKEIMRIGYTWGVTDGN